MACLSSGVEYHPLVYWVYVYNPPASTWAVLQNSAMLPAPNDPGFVPMQAQQVNLEKLPGPPPESADCHAVPQTAADNGEAPMCQNSSDSDRSVEQESCTASISGGRKNRRQHPKGCQKAWFASHKQLEHRVNCLLWDQQSLSKQLETEGDTCVQALEQLEGVVWQLSDHKDGCHLIQLAVDKAQGPARGKLVKELHTHVREAMGSPYANYVLSRVVEVMPVEIAAFIAEELTGIAAYASRHKYGCRIVCRLVAQLPNTPCVTELLRHAMKKPGELINHTFGNYVAAAILEHGSEEQKHHIAEELISNPLGHATERFGSGMVELALKHCSQEDVANLVEQLLDAQVLVQLALHRFGIYVVRGLSLLPGEPSEKVQSLLECAPPEIQQNKYYQKLLTLV